MTPSACISPGCTVRALLGLGWQCPRCEKDGRAELCPTHTRDVRRGIIPVRCLVCQVDVVFQRLLILDGVSLW